MKNKYLILFFIISTCSCQRAETDLGIAENYLPKAEHLHKGVVNKYYEHYSSGPNADIISSIYYESYELTKPNQIRVNRFSAGYEWYRSGIFTFDNNQMILSSEKRIVGYDTVQTEITQPLFLSWNGIGGSVLETIVTNHQGAKEKFKTEQIKIGDTTLLSRPAKIFRMSCTPGDAGNSIYDAYPLQVLYVEGFGLFSLKYEHPDGTNETELVEQMSLEKFTQLARHGRKRIGYIDPKEVIDQNTAFTLCDDQRKIVDYYNGSPRVEFAEKKRVMLNILFSKIDSEKLFNESGFLTFRFVVNCRGEAGWFITEQADLNYQEKQFAKETVDHLYKLIAELKTWSPCVINQEPRDAYFYITFRMENGKILDILP